MGSPISLSTVVLPQLECPFSSGLPRHSHSLRDSFNLLGFRILELTVHIVIPNMQRCNQWGERIIEQLKNEIEHILVEKINLQAVCSENELDAPRTSGPDPG